MNKHLLALTLIVLRFLAFGQSKYWVSTDARTTEQGYAIAVTNAAYFQFNIAAFKTSADVSNEVYVDLPLDEETFVPFKLTVNTTMHPALMAKYPTIKAFNAVALDGSNYRAKVEIGPDYFRAMIVRPGKDNLYIDPVVFGNREQSHYMLYEATSFISDKSFTCHQTGNDKVSHDDLMDGKAIHTCELRTYRIAISATGEYTTFHGGTVEKALAAQVTTLNRMNQIYERDLAVSMTLIANNDELIFTDKTTDPFTNGDASKMLNENQTTVNSIIGSSNYDVGHVFGTNSGGVAMLNSVCKANSKGMGVTGSNAPVGDPFDIDYVSHEVGHQFGANHTFNNSCGGNRNSSTAVEPGSGSTIMSYAGICNPNVQMNSHGYFNAMSIQEIGTALSASSHNCPVKTPLNNVEPTIISATDNIIVPKGTPFILKVEANDADGDALTYCWEQMDKEIADMPPKADAVKGPSFRSLMPTEAPVRYLPSIASQVNNSFTWERLSTEERSYKFRITVRDNAVGGGCTESKDVLIKTTAEAGPFEVTYPNVYGIVWTGLTIQEVHWDVANTTEAPINCENVKILISLDDGETFETLIESHPNNGLAYVTVPNVSTTKALIMVQSENETFFDISNRKFKINASGVNVSETELSSHIQLYPNPTTNSVTVQLDDVAIDEYRILNAQGQVVKENNTPLLHSTVLDVSNFAEGVYLFEATVGNSKVVLKLIKE